MKIFFTASIRGGRANQPKYKTIVEGLRKYGEVLSDHVAHDTMTHYGETELTSEEILEREQQRINECEIVVADVTNPSLGVGYLVSYATSQNKKVVALYRGHNLYKLSAIIRGDKLIQTFSYMDDNDIDLVLSEMFEKIKEENIL